MVAVILWAALSGREGDDSPAGNGTSAASENETRLESISRICGNVIPVTDNGRTVVVDMNDPPAAGQVSLKDGGCILVGTKMPSSVQAKISATRAIDGTQEAEWDSFNASWTYSPSSGLRIVLTEDGGFFRQGD